MKTKLLNTYTVASVILLALMAAASVRAGTIKVVGLPATGTDAASGISTNITYLDAFDFGPYSLTPTINGVPFTHYKPPGGSSVTNYVSDITDANFGGTLTLSCGGATSPHFNSVKNSSQGNLAGQADGNMYTLLSDLIYIGPNAATNLWLEQDYGGLTPGDQYSLRIYYRFWDGNRPLDVYFNGEGYQQAYSGNPLDEDAGTNVLAGSSGAYYIEYNFTAASTTVSCVMTNLVSGQSPFIYGATLENDSLSSFAPSITSGPTVVAVGIPTVFKVSTAGTAPLSYQWYYNTVSNYSGATMETDGNGTSGSTTGTLSTTNNLLDYYFVVVTNDYGSVTSSIVQINPVPAITTQSSTANVGNAYVEYDVTAAGLPPLAYQWYYNAVSNYSGATLATGSGYSGSTTASLSATTNLQDFYFVVVTNTFGSVTSSITAYDPLPYIVAQPSPFVVGNSEGFNMSAGGWPTLVYQWYMNTSSSYTGATALSDSGGVSGSTTPSVTIANVSAYYFVVVANDYGSTTSQVVRLPAARVLAAGEPIWNQAGQTNVIITFSEPLDPITATVTGNYGLDNGASILSATLVASKEVALTTSALDTNTAYTLTVQNVVDVYGITMSPSPTNVAVGVYPANIALWLSADAGVTADGSGNVSQWNDLSGNGNDLYTISAIAPQLATNSYGDPVIRFEATNATEMDAFSSSSLAITGDMSVIAVMSFDTLAGNTNGDIVSKTGSAHPNVPAPYDYNVGSTGAKFLRGNGVNATDGVGYGLYSATKVPSLGTPHILAVTEAGNTVSHYLDGQAAGSGLLSNNYQDTNNADAGQDLSIGTRIDGRNRLSGDMSELIMAGSPVSGYDVAQLDNYLIAKYNLPIIIPSLTPTNIVFATSVVSGTNELTLSWPVDHTGWTLQAQTNSMGVGLSTNWVNVPNSSTTNQMVMPINPTNGSVFYRLIYSGQ